MLRRMGEPFELAGSDAYAWISLVETGRPNDPDVRFGGALGDLPLAELAPYFAPCELVGWCVPDKKAGWAIKAKASDRDRWALIAPDGSGLGGEAKTPAGPRRSLDELRDVTDPAQVEWRSKALAAGLAFLFLGVPPTAEAIATAEKFAAKLKLEGGGDLLQFEEGANHKLRCLPPDLSRFAAARRLSLYNTGVRQLSDAILTLPALESIHVMYALLSWITPRIGELARLQDLSLQNAPIRELPPGIAKLPLRKLDLRGCQWLRRLPAELASITTLRTLVLAGCAAHGEGLPAHHGNQFPPDPEAAAVVAAVRAANPACEITLR